MHPEAIREVFGGLGLVRIRKMFGGHGIYRGDLMFALEAEGELYLKADEEVVGVWRELGSRPFTYRDRNGRSATMSYWLMPDSSLDDPEEAAELAALSVGAASRAKADRARKSRRGAGQPAP